MNTQSSTVAMLPLGVAVFHVVRFFVPFVVCIFASVVALRAEILSVKLNVAFVHVYVLSMLSTSSHCRYAVDAVSPSSVDNGS